jgi:hypothetical protein
MKKCMKYEIKRFGKIKKVPGDKTDPRTYAKEAVKFL